MKIISSQGNKLIKLASSLKQKKYRDAQGLFLIEGCRAVEEALEKPELLKAVFQEQGRPKDNPIHARTAELADCYAIDSRLMKHICSTEEPQGIAAIVKKPVWSWDSMASRKGLLILLDRVSDPGNLGSILRTSWAFDVDGVLLTRGSVDLFNPKVVRATMGAVLNIPVFADISEAQLDLLHDEGYRFVSTDISRSEKYYEIKYNSPTVIIFGSEAQGISENLKSRCKIFTNIPMNPQVDSLNVAAACAIIIAEARRQFYMEAEMA